MYSYLVEDNNESNGLADMATIPLPARTSAFAFYDEEDVLGNITKGKARTPTQSPGNTTDNKEDEAYSEAKLPEASPEEHQDATSEHGSAPKDNLPFDPDTAMGKDSDEAINVASNAHVIRISTGSNTSAPRRNSRRDYIATGSPFPKRPMFSKLSKKTWDKLEELFKKMDLDGSDAVTKDEARQFFLGGRFNQISTEAMFNEVDTDKSGAITAQEFIDFWVQVREAGYGEKEILEEIEEILAGGAWVDWLDGRNTAGNNPVVEFPKRPLLCRLSRPAWGKCEELFKKISRSEPCKITEDDARNFFKGSFADISVNAMFNEVDVNRHGVIIAKDWMDFWVQVKASGYKDKDIIDELDLLLEGGAWVDWKDNRKTE